MPCYDSRNDPSYAVDEARESWTHNSPVADMLCSVLRRAERSNIPLNTICSETVQEWWRSHKKRDAAKLKREQEQSHNELLSAEQAVKSAQDNLIKLKKRKK